MGTAIEIVKLIISVGFPAAKEIIALWHKQQPDNVTVGEFHALLQTFEITPDMAIAKIVNATP